MKKKPLAPTHGGARQKFAATLANSKIGDAIPVPPGITMQQVARMMQPTITHGGARKGAGRPPIENPLKPRSVRLPVDQWEYLDGTGNASQAVREAVGMHRKKSVRRKP